MAWVVLSFVLMVLVAVDVHQHTDSYREIGLLFGDTCRAIWFWRPASLLAAYRSSYRPRHAVKDLSIPEFMRSWHLR